MIRKLRELGGVWTAERRGWGWRYHGVLDGVHYDLDSCAHLAPRFDGDDDSFVVLWHIEANGKAVMFPSREPVGLVRMHAEARRARGGAG